VGSVLGWDDDHVPLPLAGDCLPDSVAPGTSDYGDQHILGVADDEAEVFTFSEPEDFTATGE
jgi:hypothetical protein